eukprot:UN24856
MVNATKMKMFCQKRGYFSWTENVSLDSRRNCRAMRARKTSLFAYVCCTRGIKWRDLPEMFRAQHFAGALRANA